MTQMYFAEDGNWGGAYGLTIVDTDGLDEHFTGYIDCVAEYDLSAWADWFSKNNHGLPANSEDGECYYCDYFELGSLANIDDNLADGEEE